ncbi:MAG: TRAP transporter fused permease subunit [Chloroflexota bacterium]
MPDSKSLGGQPTAVQVESGRYSKLPSAFKVIFVVLTVVGIGLAVYYLFSLAFFGTLLNIGYYYLLFACFGACVFLVMPARKRDVTIPWYDMLLAAIAFAVPFYFSLNAWEILMIGWGVPPNEFILLISTIYIALTLEGARRFAGIPYVVVIMVIGIYPLIADKMPGKLWGLGFTFPQTIAAYLFSPSGLVGLPGQIMGNIMIGFLVFAGVMVSSGAGDFFLKLATALFGCYRGGPAKISAIGSGFFGSISGSVFANIVGTGSFTIPAMKRLGYPAHYAAAIEACASTGGILMPPVMGALAFIMAIILNVEYRVIVLAATIPALLYYYGILVQVDCHAAKNGLKGIPKEELPRITTVLKDGWPFITVFFFLIWALMYMRWEAMAPFYACVLMIALSFTNKKTFLTPRRLLALVVSVGRLVTSAISVVLPMGIIVAGLTLTGATLATTAALVGLGADRIWLILVIAVVILYVMGMVGIGGYIFLAITMAPSVIALGLNPLAVHLFLLYYSMIGSFTPPVALGAFLAAALARASPMKTALTAMRLGVVIYFIPFFFVFNPSLVLQGDWIQSIYLFLLCLIGTYLLAAGIEGYAIKLGVLKPYSRVLFVVAGFLIALPEMTSEIIGGVLAVGSITVLALLRRRARSLNGAFSRTS